MTKKALLSTVFYIVATCMFILALGSIFSEGLKALRITLLLAGSTFLGLGNIFARKAQDEEDNK